MPATPWKDRDQPSYEELERRIQYLRTLIDDLRRAINREQGVPLDELSGPVRSDPRDPEPTQ